MRKTPKKNKYPELIKTQITCNQTKLKNGDFNFHNAEVTTSNLVLATRKLLKKTVVYRLLHCNSFLTLVRKLNE